MRRGKTDTKVHEQAKQAERAARVEAAQDPRTRFEVCAECGKARGIVTGYVRIRDEVFVCGECAGAPPEILGSVVRKLSLIRHRSNGIRWGGPLPEQHEVDQAIGEAEKALKWWS